MKLPNSEKAFVEITKLRDYSLNPQHESGGHKARVFQAALGLTLDDAEWLRVALLKIARESDAAIADQTPFGQEFVIEAELAFHGRVAIPANGLDHRKWHRLSAVGKLLREVRDK